MRLACFMNRLWLQSEIIYDMLSPTNQTFYNF